MHFFKLKSYCVQATFPIHHGKNYTRDGKRIHCGLQGPFYLLLTFTWIPATSKHKGLDLGLYPPSAEQRWKQRWEVARQDSLLSTMNSPPDHQRETRACPASINSLGGDTPGEKAKCKPNYTNLFFHLLCLLPSLVGMGDSSLKIALTIAYAILCFYN